MSLVPQTVPAHESHPPLVDMTIKSEISQIKLDGGNARGSQSPDNHQTLLDSNGGKRLKKRRKVNHACLYCRRSHMTCDQQRPCARCVKRNISHLCHDEPRDPIKKSKAALDKASNGCQTSPKQESKNEQFLGTESVGEEPRLNIDMGSVDISQVSATDIPEIAQPTPLTPSRVTDFSANAQRSLAYTDWLSGSSNQFQDIHNFHPNYLFNTSEVTDEYNFLNDFLSTSLLDDAYYQADDNQAIFSDTSISGPMGILSAPGNLLAVAPSNVQALASSNAAIGNAISRPASGFPVADKAREAYYMTAADPSGSDNADERMNKLLKAKYDAGMLRPFNYVKGYARLDQYMARELQSKSRQRILRQLERFRPGFRERMRNLTDMELVKVEMWFETCLMEYDRVFASMAIPACCWRRTGEIFRGNKEMAELIRVPLERLRDGKLAIHEFMAEDSLVSYWEKFGAIAFEVLQKAILTSCSLKCPDAQSEVKSVKCCFSFTVKRDTHDIPSLIIGNFLPILERR